MDAFTDSRQAYAIHMGRQIQAQREKIFKESPEAFALRLSDASGTIVTPEHILSLESGSEDLPFRVWMGAFMIMQVAESISQAVRIDAALFLAASAERQPPDIALEMMQNIQKKN